MRHFFESLCGFRVASDGLRDRILQQEKKTGNAYACQVEHRLTKTMDAAKSNRANGRVGNHKYRVLLVASHPVQYSTHLYSLMAQHPRLDLLVAHCRLQGAQAGTDPEFGVEVKWDIPLLEGYSWVHVPNRSPRPGLGRFFGLLNPSLSKLIRTGGFDAVYLCGYYFASAWIAILAAKWSRTPIIFGTDGHRLRTWDSQSALQLWLKKLRVRQVLGLGDVVLAGSSGTVAYLKSLGLPEQRILLARNVVDNEWWNQRAAEVSPAAARASWNISASAPVVLCCAKLQPWKRPQELLEAFGRANVEGSLLVFAGDGPLCKELEARAQALGLAARVRMLGFVNQSKLPSVYRAADLLVLSSEHEAFGLVVNEAMICGCPVVVSDRVGARYDLVQEGVTGFVYPSGDVDALARILRKHLPERERLHELGKAARQRMETWSPREYLSSMLEAVERVARRKSTDGLQDLGRGR